MRRSGRAVEGTGLENRRRVSVREFESHLLRHSYKAAIHTSSCLILSNVSIEPFLLLFPSFVHTTSISLRKCKYIRLNRLKFSILNHQYIINNKLPNWFDCRVKPFKHCRWIYLARQYNRPLWLWFYETISKNRHPGSVKCGVKQAKMHTSG